MSFIYRRKTLISMLFVGLTLLGIVSYKQLPIELLPNAELPFLIVQVTGQLDLDPSYMERHAIIPLEGAIGSLQGVERIDSYAEPRRGMIFVYFAQGTNLKYAYLRLQEKVDLVKTTLGEEFNVNVVRVDVDQLANQFMELQVRGGGEVDRIRHLVDNEVVPELEKIDGIASVVVSGGRQKSVEIVLNEEACKAHGVTAAQIRNLIRQNSRTTTFVGRAFRGDRQYFVNVVADYTDVRDLENLVVRRQGPVLLRDVAQVLVGVKEETSLSRVNGKEAVTVQLIRDAQTNLIALSHAAKATVARLNDELRGKDLEIVIQSNVADDMENNVNLIIKLALVGGCLAVAVLWLFLRNLRLVATIVLAIPISIFTALNLFYAFGITLNSLTLVGMALVVGMLLDNSVVVLENVYRHAAHHRSADEAVTRGTKEVWRSIVAATLTTIVVFLPFVFSSNFLIRLFGRHIGVSVVSTLLVSLVVALLLVPMITHHFLSRGKGAGHIEFRIVSQKNRLLQIYTLLLKSCMRFPVRTIGTGFVLFVAGVVIALAVSLNVSREVETVDLNLYLTMASGSTLEATDAVTRELEKRIEDIPEKQDIVSKVYEEEAVVTVRLRKDYQKVKNRSVAQVKSDIQERIRDFRLAEVSFEQPRASRRFRGGGGRVNPGASFERMLGMGTQTESIVIKGTDFARMRNVAEDVRYYLQNLESVQSVRVNVSENRPELHLVLDKALLSEYDVTPATVAAELMGFQREFTSGLQFKQGTDEYEIVIRGTEQEQEKTIDDLRHLRVPSQSGGTYELQQLGRIVYATGLATINRVNQEKQIEVTYQFLPEINSSKTLRDGARAEVADVLGNLTIPPGIAVEMVQPESELREFYYLIGAAVVLIYMILAAVFESLWLPLVVLFSIPFAAIGSFFALIVTGNSLLNANTLTGFLILFGIVVNNGIILIDYTRILRSRGFRRSRALLVAGQARVRPILITTITTIVGMFPLAMGKAEYVTHIGAPFAITVIGGLAMSTLLTLVFIPTVYAGLETLLHWLAGLDWRIKVGQGIALLLGGWLIYGSVDSAFWICIDALVLLMLIPAVTYFLMSTLRRAKSELIPAEAPIVIRLQNLVKVYDQEMRFVREWKKGKIIREKAGLHRRFTSLRDFDQFVWQLPLLGFLIYFVYFYLRSAFWYVPLSVLLYFYVLMLLGPASVYLRHHFRRSPRPVLRHLGDYLRTFWLWGFPFSTLLLFQVRWKQIGVVAVAGVLWYVALGIHTLSRRLYEKRVNIARISGRFAGMRRALYRLVLAIPIIGKKKQAFRALDQVSLEIGSGMFGLLGPNGAGKTTMMRIICGVLNQSHGKVWINGIDASQKREELQGLIGYLPQEFGSYENMTAYEFLDYQAILKNILDPQERRRRVEYVLDAVHMSEHRDEKIGSFSGGMKQRMGIAQTLLHLPRILVVDEPTAGLDPRERIRFRNLLVELSKERVVIFSTHIIEDISSSCNRVAVLHRGKLRYLGEPQEMARLAEGHVWQAYVSVEEFDALRRQLLIVHHMRDGARIRVRCVAPTAPTADAIPVRPSLEDAYLWLLRQDGQLPSAGAPQTAEKVR
ncbi:MAG: efflux RND transporter permease subunit [candidate division KSB1 bacterium]|nr:efflux RND transporter permease subunit [candidate division KSB1 bacterium]